MPTLAFHVLVLQGILLLYMEVPFLTGIANNTGGPLQHSSDPYSSNALFHVLPPKQSSHTCRAGKQKASTIVCLKHMMP